MSGCGTRSTGGPPRARSQSNVIAVVLLTGMVLAGATVVVYAGSTALSQNQDDASLDSATHSMESLDHRIRQVSEGETSEGSIDLNDKRGNVQMVTESPSDPAEAGKATITVDPPSGANTVEEIWLGTVHYERDGRSVAYQGGGIWQRTGNGSVAVSPPDITYRSDGARSGTVNFPIVSIEGDGAGSSLQIEKVDRKRVLPSLLSNPIEPGTTVTVEIRSEYYQAWASHLKSELGPPAIQTTPSDQKVTMTFESPSSSNAPSAVLSTSGGGSLAISNFGATDSYDSSNGPYHSVPHNNNADVLTKGSIDPSNKGSVRGDLIAEKGLSGTTDLSNQIEIYGRTIFGDDPDIGSSDYMGITGGSTQKFHGTFSTKDNLKMRGPAEFGGDVLVDGTLNIAKKKDFQFKNGGDIVVTGKIKEIKKAQISGSVFVRGDADKIGSGDEVRIQGDLVANGNVELEDDAIVEGEVIIPHGYSVDTTGSPTYTVNRKSASEVQALIDNAPQPITPDVPSRESADSEIDHWASSLGPSTNDNDGEDVIDSHKLDFGGTSDHTLGPGEYYLERLEVPQGQTLKLDTSSGGDVVIHVADYPGDSEVEIKGKVEVEGEDIDNKARIYIDSTGNANAEFKIKGHSDADKGVVRVPKDRSANMWVYLRPSAEAKLTNKAVLEGIIYGAEDGGSGGADIDMDNKAQVYGALLGDILEIPNDAHVHYDESLTTAEAFTVPTDVAAIDYVYFTEQTATVE